MLEIKNIGVELMPDGPTAIAYVGAGAALYMELSKWESQYADILDILARAGWSVLRTLRDESYAIDPEGTEEERKICDVLVTGEPVCNLSVVRHMILGVSIDVSLADFERYVDRVYDDGAFVVWGGDGPEPFMIQTEAVIPVLASPKEAVEEWKVFSTGRTLRKLNRADLVSLFEDEIDRRFVAIDLSPGSLITWHPGLCLRAIRNKR